MQPRPGGNGDQIRFHRSIGIRRREVQTFSGNLKGFAKGFEVFGVNVHGVEFHFRKRPKESMGVLVADGPALFPRPRFAASDEQDFFNHGKRLAKQNPDFLNHRIVVNNQSFPALRDRRLGPRGGHVRHRLQAG